MKNLIVLLFVGLTAMSCLGVVAAQELLVAPPDLLVPSPAGDVGDSDFGKSVPDLAMPPMPDPAMPPMPEPVLEGDQQGDDDDDQQGGEGSVMTPQADSWESEDYTEQLEPYFSDDYQMFQCDEPVLESTGTWLRRGFWYSEVDAVILKRDFNLAPILLIGQPVGINPGRPPLFIQSVIQNQMVIDGNKSATEATPRFTLGRFLFRDYHNRDHAGELTIYGGGEWTRQSQLDANPNNSLVGNPLFPFPEALRYGTHLVQSHGKP